jgi:hypothetical protein
MKWLMISIFLLMSSCSNIPNEDLQSNKVSNEMNKIFHNLSTLIQIASLLCHNSGSYLDTFELQYSPPIIEAKCANSLILWEDIK